MKARVLFVDHSAVLGGGELSLLDISRRFGATSTVLLLSDGPFREVLQEAGVRVKLLGAGSSVLSIRRSGGGRSPAAVASIAGLAWRLARVAREFDVLYANSQKAFVVAVLAGEIARRPVIWHLRDILCEAHFGRANIRLVTILANRFASRVIANSQATANAFLAQRGRADKVRVVYNGIDASAFAAITDTDAREVRAELGVDGRQVVGVFGRFHPWKGQHVAVDILARLPNVHAIFVGGALFGEHDYVAEVRRRVREAGIEDRVHFLGFRRDLPRLMRAVDVVLHTSQAPEPFGRVIVEGMLAGRPVVAADAGGAAEIVRHGSTGFLVPPGDVGAFAEAVARLLADPALRATLGTAGYERAIRDFSVEAMIAGVAGEVAVTTGDDRPPPANAPPDTPPAVAPVALFGLASLVGLAVAVVALFLFGWLADEMLAGDTLALDLEVRAAAHAVASPSLTRALWLVSTLGGPAVLAALGAILTAVFLRHRWWRGAMLLLLAMMGAGVLDTALKDAYRRARPAAFFEYRLPTSYSFPSGHALFAFCFFVTGAALLAPRLRSPPLRWLVWAGAGAVIVGVGFSRIYLGVHYASDVAAGYMVGLIWSSVIIVGDRVAHARARRRGGA